MLKTGRYVRYSENQQLGKLHLALLQKFGVEPESYAGSSTALAGLDSSDFSPWQERPFESWVKVEGNNITAQGRIRMSDNLDEAKLFFVDVDGKPSVRIEVDFKDFHNFNLAYHCGTPITISGTGSEQGGQLTITKVKEVVSLFGSKPGSANG